MADDARKHLAVYINDHLSGATSALELLEHLTKAYADEEVGTFALRLHTEVMEDRATLDELLTGLGLSRSPLRAAAGWAAEKLVRLKLKVDDPSLRGLHLFESLEALSLGIEGKRILWLALAAASEATPSLARVDYPALIGRAEAQRAEVERRRLELARQIF